MPDAIPNGQYSRAVPPTPVHSQPLAVAALGTLGPAVVLALAAGTPTVPSLADAPPALPHKAGASGGALPPAPAPLITPLVCVAANALPAH